MTGSAAEWSRPFRLHLDDGRVLHGVEFPNGHVAVNHPDEPGGAFTVGISLGALTDEPGYWLHGARIEWSEGDR